MDIHEYQAKELLAGFGVAIPRGGVAYSPEQAVYRASEIGGSRWAVKAQIHSGARGKAGGIKLCSNEDEVRQAAKGLLGKRLVTHQTGPEGRVVHRLYVEAAVPIEREIYLGLVLDRKSERIMVVASAQGGMEIEEIAVKSPDTIVRELVEPAVGMTAFQAREVAFGLGLTPAQVSRAVTTLLGAYRAFRDLDATMVEINPLVVTSDGQVLALDCKMTFDDNAMFRRPNVSELRDYAEEDPREAQAAEHGLNYVALDGNIGCIINGAGLAMATMDMIKHAGGAPANFLDVGGGASPERVAAAFRLVLSDPNIDAMLVNIFAGINRCDWVAQGVVQATRETQAQYPARRPPRRHQRRGRAPDPEGERASHHHRGYAGGGRRAGGGRHSCIAQGEGFGRDRTMSILIDEKTPVIFQGFTGDKATFHAKESIAYGTNVVGGVTPGKGGLRHLDRPVFNTVKDAVRETGATASIIFVPAAFCADSIMEAANAGIRLVVTITDGIPAQDMMMVKRYLLRFPKERRTTLIGPNCAGVISAGKAMMGIMPGHIYSRGSVGLVTRSGTLGYEAASQMNALGIGQTTSVGIGGDPINGSSFVDMLKLFEEDPETEAVMMIGEIGGPQEAEAALFVKENMSKPVIGYVAGLTAPKGRRMGHAGAIISAFGDTAAEKAEIMRSAGLVVAPSPAELGSTVAEALARRPPKRKMVTQ